MSNARWLLGTLAWVRRGILLGLSLFAVKIVANLTMTGVQKWIIDDVFIGGQYGMAVMYLSIFAGALIVYNAFHAIAARLIDRSAFQLNRMLTERFLERLHRWPTAQLQGERTAKLLQHTAGDVQAVVGIVQGFVPSGLQHGISLALLAGFLWWASPLLLLCVSAVTLVYIALARKWGPPTKAASKEVQDRRADLMVHIEESVAASREVIAYHRKDWEERRFGERFTKYFDAVMKEGRLENKRTLWSDPLRSLVSLLALGVGGFLVLREELSIGAFAVTYPFAVQLTDAAQGLFQFAMQLSSRMASVERLRSAMERETWTEGESALEGGVSTLALSDVRFRYAPELPDVLKGVTAAIPVGGKCAFVGESGGGKSTVAQLLVRFFEPCAGAILVNGRPLAEVDRADWTRRLHAVFQEPYLYPDTIRTNVGMGRSECTDADVERVCRVAQIHSFIEGLPDGYDTEIGERGIMLSGGQRQRLAIARALLGRPEILLLDEATSALDLDTERELQAAIDEERRGLTTIVIAHRLSTVRNADLIFVMADGAIAEAGTHEELIAANGADAALAAREYGKELATVE
ncbi:ABC transporter ATP-binding protein/permease [Paenibacillus sp. TRM 82003]|nr:ABC transporter ATP-binding protein/permease [Paenibacillus sp. TRM 82003]